MEETNHAVRQADIMMADAQKYYSKDFTSCARQFSLRGNIRCKYRGARILGRAGWFELRRTAVTPQQGPSVCRLLQPIVSHTYNTPNHTVHLLYNTFCEETQTIPHQKLQYMCNSTIIFHNIPTKPHTVVPISVLHILGSIFCQRPKIHTNSTADMFWLVNMENVKSQVSRKDIFWRRKDVAKFFYDFIILSLSARA